jgi:hypothetical protein
MNSSYSILALVLLAGSTVFGSAFADELDDFSDQLNQAWSQTNNTQQLSLINGRLSVSTNDVMGLSTKMYYYVFSDCNLTNARSYADHLYSRVQQSADAEADAFCLEMKNEVYGISLGESGSYSQTESGELHSVLDSYPAITRCLWLSRRLIEE